MDKQSINKGKQLRLIREYRGLSHFQLASKIKDVSKDDIVRFEAGFETTIDGQKEIEIMRALRCPCSFLDVKIDNNDFIIC